ncbi:hypothetical protein AB9E29_20400 [Rhizobium leguminosarum]|uniref:hypothetical protein n=1 Tax=Rhizobium leguminosarum TaxID=384 RepID=UPI003F9A411C
MITINAARLLGLQHYALDVGGSATLVLFDAVSGADAVARLSPAVTGWKNGRQTFLRPASLRATTPKSRWSAGIAALGVWRSA